MATDSNLQFIREKIYQVRSAIMYSMSDELVKLPNNIVTAVRVDDEGQLWFLSKRPLQFVSECEQSFPARLKFYRKGVSFFLEVSGKATIMNNTSEVKQPPQANAEKTTQQKPVLIKMTMINIEYVESEEKRKKSRAEIILENGYKWLLKTAAFHRHSKTVLHRLHQSSV
jgi:general stress protein 26